MGGRPRKDPKLTLLEGNPGKRDVIDTPMPDNDMPDAPDFLGIDAMEEWDRIGPELVEKGVLTRWDRGIFAIYCDLWGRAMELKADIAERGLTIDRIYYNKNGDEIKGEVANPSVGLLDKTYDRLIKVGDRLGINPASRSRIHVGAPKEKKSKMGKLISV